MTSASDVDLVYLDLCDALRSLEAVRSSPREVRRSLSRYVELSQRLTSAMRKDYGKRSLGRWAASTFSEWTPATQLLKYLRNQDQHGDQVFITVHDRHYYDVPDDVDIAGLPARQFIVDSRWQMDDQMLDRPPHGLEVSLSEPSLKPKPTDLLLPTRIASSYVLYPRSAEDAKRIADAGVADIHEFANGTFGTLTRYYEFYRKAIGI